MTTKKLIGHVALTGGQNDEQRNGPTTSRMYLASENRVPLVRCANTGYSCFIDRRGRIYDAVEKEGTHLFVTGHKTSKVTLP